jgi:hypothetical protein
LPSCPRSKKFSISCGKGLFHLSQTRFVEFLEFVGFVELTQRTQKTQATQNYFLLPTFYL